MLKQTSLFLFALSLTIAAPCSLMAQEHGHDHTHEKDHKHEDHEPGHDHEHSHDHVSFGFKPMGNLLTITEKGKTRNLSDAEVKKIVAEKMKPYFEQGMMHRIKNDEIRVQKETVSFDVVDLSGAPIQTLTFDRKTGISLDEMETYKILEKQQKREDEATVYERERLDRQKKAIEDSKKTPKRKTKKK